VVVTLWFWRPSQAQMGLKQQEICAAKWIFTLLDYDADGENFHSELCLLGT
jgi:hypothetical protein